MRFFILAMVLIACLTGSSLYGLNVPSSSPVVPEGPEETVLSGGAQMTEGELILMIVGIL